MNKIFKYKLENIDQQRLELPLPARMLSVVEQDDDIVLYSLVDDDSGIPEIPVDVLVVGTGDVLENNVGLYTFLGTVKLFGGKEIWHVFYRYVDPMRERNGDIREPQLVENFRREFPVMGGITIA